MATLSKKKKEYIRKNIGRASVEAIARELGVGEAEVRRELRKVGAESEAERSARKAPEIRLHSLKWTAAVAIIMTIITGSIYGRALNYDFVFDDHHAILDNVPLRSLSNFSKSFTDPSIFSNQPGRRMLRPLVTATYILNWAMFQDKPGGWRVLDVIFHAFNGILLFLLLDLLISRRLISAIISIAFVSHPAASEAVQFVAARSTLMAGFFVLIALYCLVVWSVKQERNWLIGAAVAYALGLLCKENVIMLVLVLPILYWAKTEATVKETFSGKVINAYVTFIIVSIAFLAIRTFGFDLKTAVLSRSGRPMSAQILTQAKVWWIYFATMFWPIHLNVYRYIDTADSLTISEAGFFGQPIVWLLGWAAIAAFVIYKRNNRLAFLGAAFSVLMLIPETVSALNLLSADRRLYLPLMGLAIVAAGPFQREEEDRKHFRIWVICLCAAVVCYISLSIVHIKDWRTEKGLFAASIQNTPKSEISWHGMAFVFAQEHQLERAEVCLKQALTLRPTYAASLRLLGAIYIEKGRMQDALQLLERAVRIEPMAQRGWYNLGLVQMNIGRIEEAKESFRKAIEQDPYYHQPHNNLGIIYQHEGRFADAVREFSEATRLDPTNKNYQLNLEGAKAKLKQINQSQPGTFPGIPTP